MVPWEASNTWELTQYAEFHALPPSLHSRTWLCCALSIPPPLWQLAQRLLGQKAGCQNLSPPVALGA